MGDLYSIEEEKEKREPTRRETILKKEPYKFQRRLDPELPCDVEEDHEQD